MTVMFKFFAAWLVMELSFAMAQEQEKKIKREQLPPAVEKTMAKESEGVTEPGAKRLHARERMLN